METSKSMTSSSTAQYLPQCRSDIYIHKRSDQMFRLAISYRFDILTLQSITLGLPTFQLAKLAICLFHFLSKYRERYPSASQAVIIKIMPKTKKQRVLSRYEPTCLQWAGNFARIRGCQRGSCAAY